MQAHYYVEHFVIKVCTLHNELDKKHNEGEQDF